MSLPTHLLLIVLCVIGFSTAGRDRRQASQSDDKTPLHYLLHKRSLGQKLLGPSLSKGEFVPYLKSMFEKRDGRNWVWVPSHGYVEIPSADMSDDSVGREGLGNLLRYGK